MTARFGIISLAVQAAGFCAYAQKSASVTQSNIRCEQRPSDTCYAWTASRNSDGRFSILGAVMKNNRRLRRKKTAAWYKVEIRRIDAWIDAIRAVRFGYKRAR